VTISSEISVLKLLIYRYFQFDKSEVPSVLRDHIQLQSRKVTFMKRFFGFT
jgi:hypothetical protein